MASTTLPGVLLTGIHASRPAANAVATGTLYSCTTHSLVYQTDGATWSTWATLTGTGMTNPMTTAGDTIYGGASGTPTRLAGGTSGYLLTSNGATSAPSWQAAAASSSRPYLDLAVALDGTDGDDFDAASLNARWTQVTGTGGDLTFQAGGGSWLTMDINSATQNVGIRMTPAAIDTREYMIKLSSASAASRMIGIGIVDTSGTGSATLFYSGDGFIYNCALSAYVYNNGQTAMGYAYAAQAGTSIWLAIKKSGTTLTSRFSLDGTNWSRTVSRTDASTHARVYVGRMLGTSTTQDRINLDIFNRLA